MPDDLRLAAITHAGYGRSESETSHRRVRDPLAGCQPWTGTAGNGRAAAVQGKSVCKHLAKRFLLLEDGVAGNDRAYTLPLTASRTAASGLLSSSGSLQGPDA